MQLRFEDLTGEVRDYRRRQCPKPMKLEVFAMVFNPRKLTFGVPYCFYDSWDQLMECPLKAVPIQL